MAGNFQRHRRLISLCCFFLCAPASAATGISLSGASSHEQYQFANGSADISTQSLSFSPWWSNGRWRLEAEVPLLRYETTAQGTIYVQRYLLGQWRTIPLTANYSRADTGIGDSYLRTSRHWQHDNWLDTYLTGEIKLPTGDADKNDGTLAVSSGRYAGSHQTRGGLNFGNDSTDVRLAPGISASNHLLWASAEAGYIWSHPGKIEILDRAMAYAGLGVTPLSWLGLAADFYYEGAASAGADPLQQWTYSLTLKPIDSLSFALSTYRTNQSPEPDKNWSLSVGLSF